MPKTPLISRFQKFIRSYSEISRMDTIINANRLIVFLIFISASAVGISYTSLPPKIPLWYSLPWGTERLFEPWGIILPILIAIGAHILNLVISVLLLKEYRIFTQILMLVSIFISALAAIIVFNILKLIY